MIAQATTREKVQELLKDLNGRQLKEVAKHFDIYLGTATVSQMRERIENGTIGAKLRSFAIRNTALK